MRTNMLNPGMDGNSMLSPLESRGPVACTGLFPRILASSRAQHYRDVMRRLSLVMIRGFERSLSYMKTDEDRDFRKQRLGLILRPNEDECQTYVWLPFTRHRSNGRAIAFSGI